MKYINPVRYNSSNCNVYGPIKNLGNFKATVFFNSIYETSYVPVNRLAVNITSNPQSTVVPNGIYYLNSFVYDSNSPSLTPLSCSQRKHINQSSGQFTITFPNCYSCAPVSKVPECIYSDAAIFNIDVTTPSSNNKTNIPLPGIFSLGEGPFEWLTRQEFIEMLQDSITYPYIYAYKSGARRGVYTDTELVAVQSISQFEEVNVIVDGLTKRFYVGESITVVSTNLSLNEGGDSGSPVLVEHNNKLKVLGLLSWGACGIGNGFIVLSPIWRIAEELNISPWDGSVIVDSNDLNITIGGRPYLRTTATTQPITHYKD